MEQQISPYIRSILSTIQHYDKKICSESTNYETTLKEKDTTINALKELNSKLKSEMDDFLKVSFAARWKNKSEQLEKQNIYLEDKISRLTTTNEKLNYKLDKLTQKNDQTIQTDVCTLTIQTNKGAIYRLKDELLINSSGQVSGKVIDYSLSESQSTSS